MAEGEERRSNPTKSGRRNDKRGPQQGPPVIEGDAKGIVDEPGPSSVVPTDPTWSIGRDPVDTEAAKTDLLGVDETVVPRPVDADPPSSTFGASAAETAFEARETAEPVETAAPSTAEWSRSAPEPESRSPIPALFGLAAALLAAAVIYLFYALSNVGPDLSPDVAALKTQVATLQSRPPVDIAGVTKRLDGADASLATLKSGLAAVSKTIDGLAATPAAAPGPTAPDVAPALATLDTQVADLSRNLGDLRNVVANLPKPEDLGPVNSKIGDVDQRVSALVGTVSALPRIDLGPLTSKLDDVDTRLKPVEAEVDAAKSPQRVAERQSAPLAVTAQAVLDAIGSGQAFPREFKALQALGADPAKLASLQAVAESGAPSLGDLQAELARLRDQVVADGAPPASGSYVERLMAGAGTLVHVRPLGSVVGDTPAAILARMNADIGADDIKAARNEWQKLPEASRSASKGLADRLTLRLDAETAARSIAATAIDAMAAPRG